MTAVRQGRRRRTSNRGRAMGPVRQHLESASVAAMTAVTGFLPRRTMLAVGSALGRLSYALDGRHRRITLDNLRLAYRDELPEREAGHVYGVLGS